MNSRTNPALARAIASALPSNLLAQFKPTVAPHSATKTHAAPQIPPQIRKTNPSPSPTPSATRHPPSSPSQKPQKPLNPNQLTAARLLLAGQTVTAVAASLQVDPYTISRWKKDPRFQAELRRQLHLQSNLLTRTAPQCATPRHNFHPISQNEPTTKNGGDHARRQ